MEYKGHILNLIDTPARRFGYEVSRSLEAVEGAILLVDVAQGSRRKPWQSGIGAQQNLVIIPAINKIDLLMLRSMRPKAIWQLLTCRSKIFLRFRQKRP